MPVYTKSLRLEIEVLEDLKLIKRVQGSKSLSAAVRELMDARGYDKKWLQHMAGVLKGESEL